MRTLTFYDVWEWMCYEHKDITKPIIRSFMTQFPQFALQLWEWWKDYQIDEARESNGLSN
jgi:hypothetical protein